MIEMRDDRDESLWVPAKLKREKSACVFSQGTIAFRWQKPICAKTGRRFLRRSQAHGGGEMERHV